MTLLPSLNMLNKQSIIILQSCKSKCEWIVLITWLRELIAWFDNCLTNVVMRLEFHWSRKQVGGANRKWHATCSEHAIFTEKSIIVHIGQVQFLDTYYSSVFISWIIYLCIYRIFKTLRNRVGYVVQLQPTRPILIYFS